MKGTRWITSLRNRKDNDDDDFLVSVVNTWYFVLTSMRGHGCRILLGGALRASRGAPSAGAVRSVFAPLGRFHAPGVVIGAKNAIPTIAASHVTARCNYLAMHGSPATAFNAQAVPKEIAELAVRLRARGFATGAVNAPDLVATSPLQAGLCSEAGGREGGGGRRRGSSSENGEGRSGSRAFVAFAAMAVVSAKTLVKTAWCEAKTEKFDNNKYVRDGRRQGGWQKRGKDHT